MFFSRLVPNRLSYRVQLKIYTHHYAKSTIAEKNVVIGNTGPRPQPSPARRLQRCPLDAPERRRRHATHPFHPQLLPAERNLAQLEGWILGLA